MDEGAPAPEPGPRGRASNVTNTTGTQRTRTIEAEREDKDVPGRKPYEDLAYETYLPIRKDDYDACASFIQPAIQKSTRDNDVNIRCKASRIWL